MATERSLIGIDFDHTFINANSDTELKKLVPQSEISEDLKRLSREKNGWISYMRGIFLHLHEHGLTQKDYEECLANMPLMPGMKELLTRAYETGTCDIVILSDANTFFIDSVLEKNSLKSVMADIFTNHASFEEDGHFQIKEYQDQDSCDLCPRNLCKGAVLEEYLANKASDGIGYERVSYVGDGSNDVCPALKLSAGNFIFARNGYPMLRKLRKLPPENIKGEIVAWESGFDILKVLYPESE